ncbi:GbsR/MarR family transcriptional regulator [Deinococcus sp. PEB2-63]
MTDRLEPPLVEQKLFIERTGVLMEAAGFPRMSGRVLAALLIAPERGSTPAEIAALLQASRASISVALNQLLLIGMIEHAPNPGERADRFRMKPGSWATLTEAGTRKLESFRQIAQDGLAVLPDGADPGPLREMEAFYRVWLALFPRMMDEWRRLSAQSQAEGGEA